MDTKRSSEFYDDFAEWEAAVLSAGGGVWDRTHDSLHPQGDKFFAMGYDGEIGFFCKSTGEGYIYL